jgi:hypothetical protein
MDISKNNFTIITSNLLQERKNNFNSNLFFSYKNYMFLNINANKGGENKHKFNKGEGGGSIGKHIADKYRNN